MQLKSTTNLSSDQRFQINDLWNQEYPINLNDRFELLLNDTKVLSHFYIETEKNQIIAWAVDFEKDEEIRFSIIVNSEFKGIGLGKKLIDALKSKHNEFYGWVIDHNNDLKMNQKNYESPIEFYVKQNFKILDQIRLETEIISAVKIKWEKETCI